MELWGARLFGDPCDECGWRWPDDPSASIDSVRRLPELYRGLVEGCSGSEQLPGLGWSVTGYVCHVADNLLSWAGRVAGVLRGGDPHVAGYDPDALGAARGYEHLSLQAALWSLEIGVEAWVPVLTEATSLDVVLLHSTRGEQRAADVAGNNAHDAHHHGWDIARTLREA